MSSKLSPDLAASYPHMKPTHLCVGLSLGCDITKDPCIQDKKLVSAESRNIGLDTVVQSFFGLTAAKSCEACQVVRSASHT